MTEKRGVTMPDLSFVISARKADPAKFRREVEEEIKKFPHNMHEENFLAGIRFAMQTLWKLEKEAIRGK